MSDWKFELGEIVIVDPMDNGNGPQGKVYGRVEYIDGTTAYHVVTLDFASNGIARHQYAPHEIRSQEQTDDTR